MEQLVVKCRCRGTNADCHLCFGTGDVLTGSELSFESYAAAPARRAPEKSEPRPRLHEREKKTDLETLFLRHAGMQFAQPARDVLLAAELVRQRRTVGLDAVLRSSLRAPRQHFTAFVRMLADAVRDSSTKPTLAVIDPNGALRDGGVTARLSADHLQEMRAAWGRLRNPRPAPPVREVRADDAIETPVRGRVLQPVSGAASGRGGDGSSPFAVLAAMNARRRGVGHVLAVSSGTPLEERVEQMKKFLSRHQIGRVYVAGSKRTVRTVGDLAAVEAVHVDNPANAAFIRSGSGVAVFDLDSSNA